MLLSNGVLTRLLMTITEAQHYTMPAETTLQRRTLMAWPQPESVLTHDELVGCRREVASIADAIAQHEPVWLYTKPSDVHSVTKRVSTNVTVKPAPVDNLWMRDIGPVFVSTPDGQLAGLDFHFNYWGEKLPLSDGHDRNIAQFILRENNVPRISAPFVAEGGAIEVDGLGTFMGTESSLINENRNMRLSKQELESRLRFTIGVSKFIWLEGVKDKDITDWHVDAQARFGPNDTVILSRPNHDVPKTATQWAVYEQAKSVLRDATNAAGRPLRIVEIEEAYTVPSAERKTLTELREHSQVSLKIDSSYGDNGDYTDEDPVTSYVNYLVVNDAVIVPAFGDKETDSKAFATLSGLFPDRHIVPVTLDWIASGGGGIHCATQQWPMLPHG